MNRQAKINARTAGKLVRKVRKLDRAWRAAGRQEGKLENALAWRLGQACRMGLGAKVRQVQIQNARRIGTVSGWE